LLVFIMQMYHDAQSTERQRYIYITLRYMKLTIIKLSVEPVSLILLAQRHGPGSSG